MAREVYTVAPSDTLEKARALMLNHMVSRLVVVDSEKRPVGVITATDIANALSTKFSSRPLASIMVSEVMKENPITITQRKTVKAAAALMLKHGVGSLPVVNSEGRLVGLITRTSLLKAFRDKFRGVATVGSMMRTSYAKAQKNHGLLYVLRMIEMDAAGKVLVFDGNKLVGVIAKSDILFLGRGLRAGRPERGGSMKVGRIRTLYGGPLAPRHPLTIAVAEDIMTPRPVTVTPDTDAAEAADLMLNRRIGALPVVNEKEEVLGVFTKLEVLEALAYGLRGRVE
jgi:CBS domain-containing protein